MFKQIIKKLFLKEKVRKEIVKKLFLNLKLSSVKEISTIYNNFEKEKNKRLELIKKEEDEETIKRQIKFFEECPFSLCLFYIKHVKPILNAKKFEDSLHNFLNHPKSILSNKFTSDMKYICSSKLTKEIYHKIKRYKEPIKIKNLLSDFKFKREEEIIKEFYIRGILLEDSISWETFLELCQNLIKKGKFTRNIKSDWIEYDLDVFKVNKDYKEKEVVLPKIYENIDFEFYSPPDLKETKF